MNYGVELYNAAGKLTYSTEMATWNFVGSFIAPANTPTDKPFEVLSMFHEKQYYHSFINAPALQENHAANVSWVGATHVVTDGTNTVDMLIVVLAR
jgi:hypothetical protein